MTVVRYQPWALIDSLQRRFDGASSAQDGKESAATAWVPPVDIYEETDRFVVLADVPGVESKDIEITAEKGLLTLRGQKRERETPDAQSRQHLERRTGPFLRSFTLPAGADVERITAKQADGVLQVTIPKLAAAQPRTIEVRAA